MNKSNDIPKKEKAIIFRIDNKDYQKFKNACQKNGLSMSELLRGDIKFHVNYDNIAKIFHLEKELIELFDRHITRIGNNLNQCTRALNTINKTEEWTGMKVFEDTRGAVFDVHNLYVDLKMILKELL